MQLHRDNALIESTGARLVVIGNGAPMFIAGFREMTGYDGPLYTDPSLEVYRAAELKRGISTFLSATAVGRTVRSLGRGFRQGRTRGDALQQGGVLVVAPDGRVLFQHISESPGDNASAARIAGAISSRA